jgi:hypothetical protein
MELDALASDTLSFRLAGRATWSPGPPEPWSANCPGCGAPLRLAPAGPTEPDRLAGICSAHQCGEAVIFRRLEGRLIIADRRRPDRRRP